MKYLNQDSPLHLADALADEIANTPAEALLGEVTEDFGDRRALAREFDAVVARAVRRSRRKQISNAVQNGGLWLSQRVFRKPDLIGVATLAVLVIAVVGYQHHDAERAIHLTESLNLQARSPDPPRLAFSDDDSGGRLAPARMPPSQLTSTTLEARSDVQKAITAYDTARAYQARDRAAAAIDRGDYPAAIAWLNDALRSCATYCQPELRGGLDSDLERAQSSLKTATAAAVAAAPPPAVQAAAAVAPAQPPPALAWPVTGRIVVTFGERTAALTDKRAPAQPAEGITIAVRSGADIRAAANGIVSYIGDDKGSGRFLLIHHDNDLNTRYGHVRMIAVKVRDQVHGGEVIAKAAPGRAGAQSPFYFEVRKGDVPVDPMQYLPRDQGQ